MFNSPIDLQIPRDSEKRTGLLSILRKQQNPRTYFKPTQLSMKDCILRTSSFTHERTSRNDERTPARISVPLPQPPYHPLYTFGLTPQANKILTCKALRGHVLLQYLNHLIYFADASSSCHVGDNGGIFRPRWLVRKKSQCARSTSSRKNRARNAHHVARTGDCMITKHSRHIFW